MAKSPIFNTLVSDTITGLTLNLTQVQKYNAKDIALDPFYIVEFPTVKDPKTSKPFSMLASEVMTVIADAQASQVLPAEVEANEKQLMSKKAAIVRGSALSTVCFAGTELDGETPVQMAVRFIDELEVFMFENHEEDSPSSPKSIQKTLARLLCTLAGTGAIPVDLSGISQTDLAAAVVLAKATEKANGRYEEGVRKGQIKTVVRGGSKAEPIRLVDGKPVEVKTEELVNA